MLLQIIFTFLLSSCHPAYSFGPDTLMMPASADDGAQVMLQLTWRSDVPGKVLIDNLEVHVDKAAPSFVQIQPGKHKLLVFFEGRYHRPDVSFELLADTRNLILWMEDGRLRMVQENESRQAEALLEASTPTAIPLAELNKRLADQMVLVQGGSFSMGCVKETDGNCYEDELPRRTVYVNSFYISRFEVTASEWYSVMGRLPDMEFICNECPVESVSWMEVQDFLDKLNELTGKKYRLPTEAEWEYAARGGKLGRGFKYAGGNDLGKVGWFSENSNGKPQPVGKLMPNELGLHDMSGNVWEWCSDWASDNYRGMETDNPKGPAEGEFKIVKGGSWYNQERNCSVFYRGRYLPQGGGANCGLRLASDK